MAKPVQTNLSDNIDARLVALGISAREASLKTGRGPDVIRNIKRAAESGRDYNPRADTLQVLAEALETTPEWLLSNIGVDLKTKPLMSGYRPPPELLGDRDLKVFASAECGPGEMMVFSTDPIDVVPRPWFVEREPEAFGVVATGDSMEPVYEAGDIVIVSPRAALVKAKDAIFSAEPIGGDFRASLKRYRGQTTTKWLAKQFNPPEGQSEDFELDRDIWRRALRVVGSYDG